MSSYILIKDFNDPVIGVIPIGEIYDLKPFFDNKIYVCRNVKYNRWFYRNQVEDKPEWFEKIKTDEDKEKTSSSTFLVYVPPKGELSVFIGGEQYMPLKEAANRIKAITNDIGYTKEDLQKSFEAGRVWLGINRSEQVIKYSFGSFDDYFNTLNKS